MLRYITINQIKLMRYPIVKHTSKKEEVHQSIYQFKYEHEAMQKLFRDNRIFDFAHLKNHGELKHIYFSYFHTNYIATICIPLFLNIRYILITY